MAQGWPSPLLPAARAPGGGLRGKEAVLQVLNAAST